MATKQLPSNFGKWFGRGTKPADWDGELPSLSALENELKAQKERIEKDFAHRMDEKLQQPTIFGEGLVLHTYGEVMGFTLYHEGACRLHTRFTTCDYE